ncbi:MAG: hypothetical protein HYW62_00980 [Candidatus Levybacteria bacterium]|nr:hypothetical protein [Candidatus Levybacteria bacterium]
MTRKLPILILPLFLLVFVSTVNAQTNKSTDSASSRLKEQTQLLRGQKKDAVMDIGQQIKETVAAKRDAVKEAVATRREEFRAKLQTIKDLKKKALVERIDTKLANANAKHTERFTQVLSNLQTILDKMSEDVDKTQAQAAIDAAKAAVENQAAKTYTITISTEIALRSDVGKVTSQLRLDLVAAYKLIIDAKQAVQNLRAEGAMIKEEPTSTAN